MNHPDFEKGAKTALVVDCDYKNIPFYNKRELPISNDFYLPESFHLVYASADKPNDGLANRLIKRADYEASNLLKQQTFYS